LNLNSLDILLTDEEHFEHNDFASRFFPLHKRKDIREFQDFCTKNSPSKILEHILVRIVLSGSAIERAYYISKIEDVLEDGLSQKGDEFVNDIKDAIESSNKHAKEISATFYLNTLAFNLDGFLKCNTHLSSLHKRISRAATPDAKKILKMTIGSGKYDCSETPNRILSYMQGRDTESSDGLAGLISVAME
jgi:hypothetical protein